MALIIPVRGFSPQFGDDVFLAENATVIGDVIIGDQSSIWFQAVVRGDVNAIRIGKRVNIQDGAIIHCTYQKSETHIGDDVSVGHKAIIHGCTIEEKVLVGMGAIIMDGALIQSNCLIAAGSVVLENQVLESGFLYAGAPAVKKKHLDEETFRFHISRTAKNYIDYANWFEKK